MNSHLQRIRDALEVRAGHNDRPAVDEPANEFEKIVNDWAENQALIAEIKSLLKPLETEERRQRDSLADGLRDFYGKDLKEGVNKYELSNGRTLKFTHKTERKIDEAMIAAAREAYSACDEPKPFDDLLRLKYELSVTPWRKLGDAAKTAVSRMITAKTAAPVLEVD